MADETDEDLIELANEMALPEETLALRIDASLDSQIWNGTTFMDRTSHAVSTTARDLVTQMERSLMQQESYDEFSHRMMKQMGIEDTSAKGVLRDWINQLTTEASTAWNQAMVAANQSYDTTLVWESVLEDTTTEECGNNHGRLIDVVSEDIPAHFRCKCGWRTIPNPNSSDPDTAAEGQAILDEMAAEREAWLGT